MDVYTGYTIITMATLLGGLIAMGLIGMNALNSVEIRTKPWSADYKFHVLLAGAFLGFVAGVTMVVFS